MPVVKSTRDELMQPDLDAVVARVADDLRRRVESEDAVRKAPGSNPTP